MGTPGVAELAPLAAVAVAQARDAVGEVQRIAQRIPRARRVDVDQLGREVGVHRGRRHPQHDLDGAGHLGGLPQGLGLEDEDVGARAQRQIGRAAAVERRPLALVEAARAP